MAITAGETLSLNNLGSATGVAAGPRSLSAAKGNTTGPIAMSSFGIDSVGTLNGYTYAVEDTQETYRLSFIGSGSNFTSRIASRGENFTWSVASGTTISLTSNNGETAVFTVSNRPNTTGTLQPVSLNTLRVKFADGFNDHATNYNTNRDKPVYSVDSYDGNSTALCLTADTPVTLADGSTLEIGDLEEGMKLKGYSIDGLLPSSEMNFLDWNSDSLNVSEKEVTIQNIVFSFSEKIYNINDGTLKCTAEHPFLVKTLNGEYKFIVAHLLREGDSLIKSTEDGVIEEIITSIDIEMEASEIVTIDVEDVDTYLANGYITHNKGGDSHTDLAAPGAPTTLAYSHPSLSWSGGSSSGTTGITAYDVQIDNNSDFSSPLINETNWNDSSIQLAGGVVAAGTYYARVRNIDHGLKSTWKVSTAFSVVV